MNSRIKRTSKCVTVDWHCLFDGIIVNRLAEEIKKLVKEAVQQEMDNEGKTYHYTKRFQKHLKTTKEDSLVNRIEKTVEEKIKQLENEVTELRKVKLNKGKKYRTLDDLDDEDGVNRDGQW